MSKKVVIIGAGIVGCALADELTQIIDQINGIFLKY
jgi:L-2-hydroxyglutarate oxidase LhgO